MVYLRNKEQHERFTEMTQNRNDRQRHSRPVTERVADEHSRGVLQLSESKKWYWNIEH